MVMKGKQVKKTNIFAYINVDFISINLVKLEILDSLENDTYVLVGTEGVRF